MKLVEIAKIDPTIIIEARYASTDNIIGEILYPSARLYLVKQTAERLTKVSSRLKKQNLRLKIWDAYRPVSVQKKLWQILPDDRYVASPEEGSRHNRGCAVDLTLVDLEGKELQMPTGHDEFGEKAHCDCMIAPKEAIKNREILRGAMMAEGFLPLDTEWWHFDDPDWEKYPVTDRYPN